MFSAIQRGTSHASFPARFSPPAPPLGQFATGAPGLAAPYSGALSRRIELCPRCRRRISVRRPGTIQPCPPSVQSVSRCFWHSRGQPAITVGIFWFLHEFRNVQNSRPSWCQARYGIAPERGPWPAFPRSWPSAPSRGRSVSIGFCTGFLKCPGRSAIIRHGFRPVRRAVKRGQPGFRIRARGPIRGGSDFGLVGRQGLGLDGGSSLGKGSSHAVTQPPRITTPRARQSARWTPCAPLNSSGPDARS